MKLHHSIINFYQTYLSPDTGLPKVLGFVRTPSCVFTPRCSEYARLAIDRYGYTKGIILTLRRLLRCHPWQKKHFDPVP